MIRPVRLSLEVAFEAAQYIPKHKGECRFLHGHSYKVGVSLSGQHDDKNGIFIDFKDIKNIIRKFDHRAVNRDTNIQHNNCNMGFKIPSAENLSRYFALKIVRLNPRIIEVSVTVYETESACATTSVINPKLKEE